ncbi:MAG TPA: GNAT family N-acetyltransferase [Micromonosporaceae bacterium]
MASMSLRDVRESDLPELFEIQRDQTAQHMAAFINAAANDRDAYLRKWLRILADETITNKAILLDGELVGSVASFVVEGDTEVTYWIRRDCWGRGIATAALAELLNEVATRPIYGRTAYDNVGSMRVLERNGFVRVGEEQAYAEARQATITEVIFKLA